MLEPYIKFLATLYTVILISAVTALLLFGDFKLNKPATKGQKIQAIMVDISQLTRSTKTKQKVVQKKPQKPKQEPIKQKPVKEKIPEKIIKKETQPKKVKKPEIIKPKIDKQKLLREKAEKEELKRIKKLQEEIRKKKLAALKRRQQAEKDLQELLDNKEKEQVTAPQVVGDPDAQQEADERTKLLNLYQQAVVSSVERQWHKPASSTKNLICHVRVKQLIGGTVMDASIASPCNANKIVQKSIIDAIKKASPLPYVGFEEVFDRSAIFIFQPKE